MSAIEDQVWSTLEILGFEEARGVISKRDPANPDIIKDLVPTINEVAILYVRFPGGPAFGVTVDGTTFAKVNQPLLDAVLKKSVELRDSRSRISVAPKTTPSGV